jgi:hypothetical protein
MRRVEVAIPAGPPEDVADAVDARVSPTGSLENLSQQEVDRLRSSGSCALAVLNSGGDSDDAQARSSTDTVISTSRSSATPGA